MSSDTFSRTLKTADAGDDPLTSLERAVERMRRAMVDADMGSVQGTAYSFSDTHGSRFSRETMAEVRKAIDHHNLELARISITLTVRPDASKGPSHTVYMSFESRSSYKEYGSAFAESVGDTLKIEISGSNPVFVDGLERAAVNALERLGEEPLSAPLAIQSSLASESEPASHASLATAPTKPESTLEWLRRTGREHAMTLIIGVVVVVIGTITVAALHIGASPAGH